MNRTLPSILSWSRFAGNRRLFLVCLLLFLSSTFLSLWAFFPADVLQRRLLQEASQQTGLAMQGRNASMLFPVGLGLNLSIYPDIPKFTDIELTSVRISPVWSSIFSNNQKVNLVGSLAGGNVDADVGRNGQVTLKFKNISLAALQQLDMPYRISGQLTGQLDGENLSPNMNGRGHFSLSLEGTKVLGLERIGLPVNFTAGAFQLEGKLDQRRLSLEKVILTGGALELSGGGNILIGESSEQTRLNLNVRLHPTSTTPDSLRDLLNLTGVRPTADGSYLLRIGGTMAKPVVR